ncbi:DUF6114 domain-containing protein [Gandjariella thermophila]|uniref:Uncharacterized protein n=1 Tax=Gandjariella thermophila TaxID=1931992 RepID=A0A4D4J6L4_9PSEU|nr:DUF6114 domain-containing protein [Gandjariella thermophila]GDY32385.1 hypothetical protein GTS_40180 [Gandjariella thermophila]
MWARVVGGWRVFRRWRHGRPFWAGLFLLASGVVILLPPYATLRFGDMVISINTLGGVSALVIGCLLLVCAATMWLRPRFRLFAGTAAVLLSLVALVTSNLGGFLVGTVLGLVGGALAVAWSDRRPARRGAGRRRAAGAPAAPMAVALAVLLGAALVVGGTERAAAVPAASAAAATFTFPFPFPPFPTRPTSASSTPTGRPSGSPGPSATTTSRSAPAQPPATTSAPPATRDVPVVPKGRAWTLQATRLEMGGLTFQGLVDGLLNGQPVKLLRFTASSIKITNLVQSGDAGNGHRITTSAAPGSVSTITPGPIELRTQVLRGKLLGIGNPITIDIGHPPPLMIPGVKLPFPIFFTDATVLNTDLDGGVLHIPGGRVTIS